MEFHNSRRWKVADGSAVMLLDGAGNAWCEEPQVQRMDSKAPMASLLAGTNDTTPQIPMVDGTNDESWEVTSSLWKDELTENLAKMLLEMAEMALEGEDDDGSY